MKKSPLILITLLIIGIGTALIIKLPTNTTTYTPPTQDSPLSWDISSSWDTKLINSWDNQASSWSLMTGSENPLVYTNTEFWFQLTLPKWWEDYKAFIYHLTGDDIISNISITLPTTIRDWPWVPNPEITHSLLWVQDFSTYITWYANIINILVRNSDSYKQIIQNCKLGTEEECLTKNLTLWNNNYYFTYTTRQELPTDITNRIKNNWISYIKSSFKYL